VERSVPIDLSKRLADGEGNKPPGIELADKKILPIFYFIFFFFFISKIIDYFFPKIKN